MLSSTLTLWDWRERETFLVGGQSFSFDKTIVVLCDVSVFFVIDDYHQKDLSHGLQCSLFSPLFSIHMAKIPRTELHPTNLNHDASLTTFVGCGSSSNIETCNTWMKAHNSL